MQLKRVMDIDWRQPLSSFAFTGAVAVIAIWIYKVSFHVWSQQLGLILFFAGLVMMAESLHVRLPHVEGFVSVGSAICLAALLTLGPPGAAIASSLGVMLANLFSVTQALDVIIFNGGQLAITSYLSGLVWVAAGGMPGVPLVFPRQLPSLLATMAAYALINMTLATVGISLASRRPLLRTWWAGLRWTIPNYAGTAPLGILAAESYYSSLSVYGILLLWIPLLFARYSFQQYWEIRKAHMKTIEALAVALDARDTSTAGHSERVSLYASTMATYLELPDPYVEQIRFAGILHDIGKIGISDLVLNKKGSLDEKEFALIQGHSVIGAEMLQSIGFMKDVGEIIRHHHERYDGQGYPDGLSGEAIPLGARIMAVADAFDAMTCDRVYRIALLPEEATQRLTAGKGSQFDGKLVDVFVKVWETTFDHGRKAPLPSAGASRREPNSAMMTQAGG